ncbi:MAG: hypothetical protein JJT75_09110 [Opitutales bacterium]|nr:hypothetical protein [Opitutales bacterium]MCH8539261.1 hypothetical protein [Opitutales bacterium]
MGHKGKAKQIRQREPGKNLGVFIRTLQEAGLRGRSARAGAKIVEETARSEGLLINPRIFRPENEIGEGAEHTVYLDASSQRVLKITHPDLLERGGVGQSRSVTNYLEGLLFHNKVYGMDFEFEGIIPGDGRFPQYVVSATHIVGDPPDQRELIGFMEHCGFTGSEGSWSGLGKVVCDVVPNNAVKVRNPEGPHIIPIDFFVEPRKQD